MSHDWRKIAYKFLLKAHFLGLGWSRMNGSHRHFSLIWMQL